MKGNRKRSNNGNRDDYEFVVESSSDNYDSDDFWFSSADEDDYGDYDDEVPPNNEEFKGEQAIKIRKKK